jgi:hypothetical protein
MSNPLYSALGGSSPIGNMSQMVQSFNQFRQTFKGDPKQKVMEMLQSGQISQAQLNQAQNMANQFSQFLR